MPLAPFCWSVRVVSAHRLTKRSSIWFLVVDGDRMGVWAVYAVVQRASRTHGRRLEGRGRQDTPVERQGNRCTATDFLPPTSGGWRPQPSTQGFATRGLDSAIPPLAVAVGRARLFGTRAFPAGAAPVGSVPRLERIQAGGRPVEVTQALSQKDVAVARGSRRHRSRTVLA
jgi:hypothetical protein